MISSRRNFLGGRAAVHTGGQLTGAAAVFDSLGWGIFPFLTGATHSSCTCQSLTNDQFLEFLPRDHRHHGRLVARLADVVQGNPSRAIDAVKGVGLAGNEDRAVPVNSHRPRE